MPDSGLDYRRAQVTVQSSTRTTVEGFGLYRRDRWDRGRQYEYQCAFNPRSGVTKASYRWTGSVPGLRAGRLSRRTRPCSGGAHALERQRPQLP